MPAAAARDDRRRSAPVDELTIRRSTVADGRALARLAQLDSAAPPQGDHLLVEEDGQLRAALPLAGGRPISDPLHRTAELVAMLELRAPRLDTQAEALASRRGVRRRWRLRGTALPAARPAAH